MKLFWIIRKYTMEYWGVKQYFIYSLLIAEKNVCECMWREKEWEKKNEQEKNCDKMLIFEFAQGQYHSQWGFSKAWFLLIENVSIWEFWVKAILWLFEIFFMTLRMWEL